MSHLLKGTGIALVTPFRAGKIDYDSLKNLINHVIEGGVEYVVSLGTTGETPTLSSKEQIDILEFTVQIVNKRVPVVAGFGGNNTAQIVETIESYHFEGVDAILSSSPNYNKPSQEGIFQHFMAIAKVAPRPVIIYNVPGRTSSNIEADTTLRLAKASDKFIAVKEASGNMVQCMKIAKYKPKNFLLLSGDDVLTLPMLAYGCEGVISVIGNALPRQFSDMVRLGLSGDFTKGNELHQDLLEIMELIFVEGNPVGVKGALHLLGVCEKEVRLPLVEASIENYTDIREALVKLGMEVGVLA
ncbi:MAG: 4-hydroxy-tetrahydrodipicolinate synthase [Saprospiraceae bacterium]